MTTLKIFPPTFRINHFESLIAELVPQIIPIFDIIASFYKIFLRVTRPPGLTLTDRGGPQGAGKSFRCNEMTRHDRLAHLGSQCCLGHRVGEM